MRDKLTYSFDLVCQGKATKIQKLRQGRLYKVKGSIQRESVGIFLMDRT